MAPTSITGSAATFRVGLEIRTLNSPDLWTAAKSVLLLSIVLVAISLCGCQRSPDAPLGRRQVAPGSGMVRGTVRFTGEIPPISFVGGDCFPGAELVPNESAVVNPDGTMKNVVIFIKNGPNIETADPPEAVLAQKSCRYVPHVRALRTGQVINVTNHDPTPHNVLVQSDENPSANIEELQGGSHGFQFDHPGIVRFKCQVHPWMTAYVHVFDNPCFAVTGDDGKFEIAHLPPGVYTLVAWQEKYGQIEKSFTVNDDKPVTVDFDYRP